MTLIWTWLYCCDQLSANKVFYVKLFSSIGRLLHSSTATALWYTVDSRVASNSLTSLSQTIEYHNIYLHIYHITNCPVSKSLIDNIFPKSQQVFFKYTGEITVSSFTSVSCLENYWKTPVQKHNYLRKSGCIICQKETFLQYVLGICPCLSVIFFKINGGIGRYWDLFFWALVFWCSFYSQGIDRKAVKETPFWE